MYLFFSFFRSRLVIVVYGCNEREIATPLQFLRTRQIASFAERLGSFERATFLLRLARCRFTCLRVVLIRGCCANEQRGRLAIIFGELALYRYTSSREASGNHAFYKRHPPCARAREPHYSVTMPLEFSIRTEFRRRNQFSPKESGEAPRGYSVAFYCTE